MRLACTPNQKCYASIFNICPSTHLCLHILLLHRSSYLQHNQTNIRNTSSLPQRLPYPYLRICNLECTNTDNHQYQTCNIYTTTYIYFIFAKHIVRHKYQFEKELYILCLLNLAQDHAFNCINVNISTSSTIPLLNTIMFLGLHISLTTTNHIPFHTVFIFVLKPIK